MSISRSFTFMFVTLFLFWLLLNGSFAHDVLVVGLFVVFAIAALFFGTSDLFAEIRWTPMALVAGLFYLVYFLKELFRANLRLARIVLSPSLPLKPGIVRVRTRLQTRMGRLMLANSITLTPGTLTVALEGEWLYVHWVSVESDDVESATARIVSGFEQYLEVMYG